MSDLALPIVVLVVITLGVLFAVQMIAFRILRIVLRFVIAIAAVGAVLVLLQPDTFHVSRTSLIAAPPAQVFAQVNDFHRWETWSPWAKIDPEAKTTFEGAAAGEGAVFRWSGNHEVGQGSNTIVESVANERIRIRLGMERPVKAENEVEFTFAPESGGTRVTWSIHGKNDTLSKALGLFVDCDQMIGAQFEQGLANLATASGALASGQ